MTTLPPPQLQTNTTTPTPCACGKKCRDYRPSLPTIYGGLDCNAFTWCAGMGIDLALPPPGRAGGNAPPPPPAGPPVNNLRADNLEGSLPQVVQKPLGRQFLST